MNRQLSTENYNFYIENDQLLVRYLDRKLENQTVNLGEINTEMLGVMQTGDSWNVIIVTPAGLQKVKRGIKDNLEVIGFNFKDLQSALAVQNFIAIWLERLAGEE